MNGLELEIADEKYPPEDFCRKYCEKTFNYLSKIKLNIRVFSNDSKLVYYHKKAFQEERREKCDKCLATLLFNFLKKSNF